MHEVRLTARQAEYAERLGIARFEWNRAHGRRWQRLDSSVPELECSLRGAYAEVAVAVAEGLLIRVPLVTIGSLSEAVGPDVGIWQVKYNSFTPPVLLVPAHQRSKRQPDPLLLVGGERPRLFIAGWINAYELFEERNIRPIGRRFDAYVAPYLHEWTPGLGRRHAV